MRLRFLEGSQCLCRVFVEEQPECIGFFFHFLIERGLENQLDAFGLHLDKTRINLVTLWYAYKAEPREPTTSVAGKKGAQYLPLVPIREAYVIEKNGVG